MCGVGVAGVGGWACVLELCTGACFPGSLEGWVRVVGGYLGTGGVRGVVFGCTVACAASDECVVLPGLGVVAAVGWYRAAWLAGCLGRYSGYLVGTLRTALPGVGTLDCRPWPLLVHSTPPSLRLWSYLN